MEIYVTAIQEAADSWTSVVQQIPDYELVVGKILFEHIFDLSPGAIHLYSFARPSADKGVVEEHVAREETYNRNGKSDGSTEKDGEDRDRNLIQQIMHHDSVAFDIHAKAVVSMLEQVVVLMLGDDMATLQATLQNLGAKHARVGVMFTVAQAMLLETALLRTLAGALQPAGRWTPPVQKGWSAVVKFVAKALQAGATMATNQAEAFRANAATKSDDGKEEKVHEMNKYDDKVHDDIIGMVISKETIHVEDLPDDSENDADNCEEYDSKEANADKSDKNNCKILTEAVMRLNVIQQSRAGKTSQAPLRLSRRGAENLGVRRQQRLRRQPPSRLCSAKSERRFVASTGGDAPTLPRRNSDPMDYYRQDNDKKEEQEATRQEEHDTPSCDRKMLCRESRSGSIFDPSPRRSAKPPLSMNHQSTLRPCSVVREDYWDEATTTPSTPRNYSTESHSSSVLDSSLRKTEKLPLSINHQSPRRPCSVVREDYWDEATTTPSTPRSHHTTPTAKFPQRIITDTSPRLPGRGREASTSVSIVVDRSPLKASRTSCCHHGSPSGTSTTTATTTTTTANTEEDDSNNEIIRKLSIWETDSQGTVDCSSEEDEENVDTQAAPQPIWD